jgi:hypothetical protein
LEFGVWDLGSRVWGLGFGVRCSGFGVRGSGFGVEWSEVRVHGSTSRGLRLFMGEAPLRMKNLQVATIIRANEPSHLTTAVSGVTLSEFPLSCLRTLTWKSRPESGLDCLMRATFARSNLGVHDVVASV